MTEDIEKQNSLKELEKKTIAKLSEAIDMNKANNRTKESRNAKAEACALLLVSIRAGVQFDLNDPIFQVFVQKQSWRDAMERACKDICDPATELARNTMEIINLIPGLDKVGDFLEKITNLFNKTTKREDQETYNHDLWNDFYDDLPKGSGNGPSLSHKNYNESPSKFQNFLSLKATDGKRRNALINPSSIQKYLSELANVENKPPQKFSKNFLLSKNRSSNNAA